MTTAADTARRNASAALQTMNAAARHYSDIGGSDVHIEVRIAVLRRAEKAFAAAAAVRAAAEREEDRIARS